MTQPTTDTPDVEPMGGVEVFAQLDDESGDITGNIEVLINDDDGDLLAVETLHSTSDGLAPYTSVKLLLTIEGGRLLFAATGRAVAYVEDHADPS